MAKGSRTLFGVLNKLSDHKDKNFVHRILAPEGQPKLHDNEGGILGQASTHSMAWGTDENGDAFVYPTVVQPNKDERLQRLDAKAAWKHAKLTGERIPFGQDHEEADWFSRNYKKVWKP